jgi:hypothetical protein
MDLSIELKSRLGEYGSAGSFAVCPFAVPAKPSTRRNAAKKKFFITLFASV